MIERNKDYYKAQVKKLKAKNKELKEDAKLSASIAGIGWGLFLILLIFTAIKWF